MTANDITTVIDHIAKKLEVPANKLMTLAPQLGVVDVIYTSVCFFIAVLLGSITALGIHMMSKREELRDGDPLSLLMLAVVTVSGMISFLFTMLALANLTSAILWFYNPQVWLLHKVFHF